MTSEPIDAGTGYTRKPSSHNAALTEVGRGEPMGELLRRYWHPIGLVADAAPAPAERGTRPEASTVGGRLGRLLGLRRRPRDEQHTEQ